MKTKTLLQRIADWFNQADQGTHSAPLIMPNPPVPPALPPPPPEPSCFVKGLIHSMKTEPESWERKYLFRQYWYHQGQDVILYSDSDPYYCPASPLLKHESQVLAAAVQEYLVQPAIRRDEEEVRKKEAAKRAHFERLGCPDKST